MASEPKTPLVYDGRLFSPAQTKGHSETTSDTIFHYKQIGMCLSATYSGGEIEFGHLLGKVNEDNSLDFHYHHLNKSGEIMTGQCHSEPEILANGKIRLHETWQWTCGDKSHGTSILEEL